MLFLLKSNHCENFYLEMEKEYPDLRLVGKKEVILGYDLMSMTETLYFVSLGTVEKMVKFQKKYGDYKITHTTLPIREGNVTKEVTYPTVVLLD